MNPIERKDLYHLLSGLSNKLTSIAEDTDDFSTEDRLYELIEVIDDSVDKLVFSRND